MLNEMRSDDETRSRAQRLLEELCCTVKVRQPGWLQHADHRRLLRPGRVSCVAHEHHTRSGFSRDAQAAAPEIHSTCLCRDWQEGTHKDEGALELYETGQPSDVFTLILQGKAFIRAGKFPSSPSKRSAHACSSLVSLLTSNGV